MFNPYWFYDERYDPKEQAQLWVETIKDNPGVLGAWLDLEEWKPGPYNTWSHWKECMQEFEALLPKVILGVYTRKNYFDKHVGNNYAYFVKHPVWVAHYTTDPKPLIPTGWTDWTIWQFSQSGDGKAHGVKSDNIDMDRYNLDEATFKQRFGVINVPTGNKFKVTADPFLFVREGPDRSRKDIGRVNFNDVVEKLEENGDKTWFKIRNAESTLTGWSSATFLEKTDESISHDDEHHESSETRTTNPAKGVTRVEGEQHGTRYYLTMCNPADVTIEVVHEDSRPSVIAKKRGAKFAFNGDDWQRNTRKVKGTEICNGKVYQKRKLAEPSLIVTKDGKVYISHKDIQGQWNVTSGLRYLVQNGINKIPPNGTELKYTERHARSVRGIHGDGRIMFLTVDGDYVHKGMTLWEAAELMIKFGCFVAYDGGGGGDSVDVVDGAVVNVPDDEDNGTPVERKVPQTILVFTKP
ncbi:MAG: phosphodiester glycosidase family protein [Chloroflexi bacterium]|nr:phosphodiester glycosidase family protein [Chloroflexota bacterium]